MSTTRLLVITMLCMMLGTPATAAPPPTFRVGQQVQFKFLGDWTIGTVDGIDYNGWCSVSFERRGQTKQSLFPPNRLRKANPTGAAPERAKVGQSVEFEYFGSMIRGRVITVGDVFVTVRFKDRGDQKEKRFGHDRVRVIPGSGRISITTHSDPVATKAAPRVSNSFAVEPRRDEARRLAADDGVKWQYQPVGARVITQPATGSIELGYGTNIFSRPGPVFGINDPAWTDAPALVASSSVSNDRGGIHLQRFHFEDRVPRSAGVFEGPGNRRLLSASPDGVYFALTNIMGAERFIEFHRVVEGKLTPHLRVEPTSDKPGLRPAWARMISATRALTALGGQLELWDVKSGAQLIVIESSSHSAPFVDASCAHAFVPQGKGTTIVALASGRAVAHFDRQFTPGQHVTVRPDGAQLAWLEYGCVVLMNLEEDATPDARLALPAAARGRSIEWLDNRTMLLDRRLTFDIERRAVTGRLDPEPRTFVSCANGLVWLNGKGESMGSNHVLAGCTAPRATRSPRNLMEAGPVSVRVSTGDAKSDDRLGRRFAARLRDRGVEVRDQGDIRLVINAVSAGTENRSYHSTVDGKRHNHVVNKVRWSVAIEFEGRPCWSTGGEWQDLPMIVSLRKGQTIEEAARDEVRPLADSLRDVPLPTFVSDQAIDAVELIGLPESGAGVTADASSRDATRE